MGTKIRPGAYDCLSSIADDEPYFVLRAKDKLAPIMVELWTQLAMEHGLPSAKAAEAIQCAKQMREWAQRLNEGQWPD